MPRRTQKPKHTVDVDTGTVIVIDPGYLFSAQDWKEVAECAYPTKKKRKGGSYKACLRRAIEKRGGRVGNFTVVGTGGDGAFPVRCKRDAIEIESDVCNLEK